MPSAPSQTQICGEPGKRKVNERKMLMGAGVTDLDVFNVSRLSAPSEFHFFVVMTSTLENKRPNCACDTGNASTRRASGASIDISWALVSYHLSGSTVAGLVCGVYCQCRQSLKYLHFLNSALEHDVRRRARRWNRRRDSSLP